MCGRCGPTYSTGGLPWRAASLERLSSWIAHVATLARYEPEASAGALPFLECTRLRFVLIRAACAIQPFDAPATHLGVRPPAQARAVRTRSRAPAELLSARERVRAARPRAVGRDWAPGVAARQGKPGVLKSWARTHLQATPTRSVFVARRAVFSPLPQGGVSPIASSRSKESWPFDSSPKGAREPQWFGTEFTHRRKGEAMKGG